MPTGLPIEDGGTGNFILDVRHSVEEARRQKAEQERLKSRSDRRSSSDLNAAFQPEVEPADDSKKRLKGLRMPIPRLVGRATGIAVRLLPSAEQARYAEEYQAELSDLVQVSRWAQWAYVLRLIACAPLLRRELLRSVRTAVER